MSRPGIELTPIGTVESPLTDRASAPRQGDEGAPDAWLEVKPWAKEIAELVLWIGYLRWHFRTRGTVTPPEPVLKDYGNIASRDVLRVHPRGDTSRPEQGVFNTRSPDRPNPIGLHRVEIAAIVGCRVQVRNLEALDGTPIVDVKPMLRGAIEER